MKAAVCYEFGKLVIEDVDLAPVKPDEVKVRLAATAICHSDIHVIRGDMPVQLPIIPGHESAGYVEEVGTNVTMIRPGDPVVIAMLTFCGHCYYCLSGLPHLCTAFPVDMPGRLYNKKGQNLLQMSKTGGFAEYTVVHETQLAKVPADMPLDRAALLACGVITGFGAAVNRVRVKPLSSTVVVGAGGVGLNAVQGAVFCGAFPVIAVDIYESKLETARIFGATHTINAAKDDAVRAVRELTSGRGADYVFVTGGGAKAVDQGYALTARRGTLVLIALPQGKESPAFPFLPEFIGNEKTIMGSFLGATKLQIDIPRLVALYRTGRLKLDELITGRYPLEQINEAIASVEKGQAIRNVIIF